MQRTESGDPSGRGAVAGYRVPFPGVMYHYLDGEIEAALAVMRSPDSLTQGKHLKQFEADFEEFTGARHAFGVDNCTNALQLAAILSGVGPGDEVIVPAYTFCATPMPFGQTGATLVWADIDSEMWVVSPKDVVRKITERTKVIVVVHLLGMTVDMDPIMALAKEHNLLVVEDCAQAPGARYKGRRVGTIGDFGCFSFHTAKNMTTLGEGGMLTVARDEHARHVPALRWNGCQPYEGERERYWVPAMSNVDLDLDGVWPRNFCLGEVQCAVGSAVLKRLDQVNKTLVAQGMRLREGLADVSELTFHKIPGGHDHVFHQFVAHFDGSAFGKNRNDLLDLLTREFGMRMIVQYYPLYRYPLFQKRGFGEADCPNLDAFWDGSFSYPWWCGMPAETIDYMIDATRQAVGRLKGE